MAVTAVANIHDIQRGDTVPYHFTFNDELAAPIDMRGKTLIMTFKVTPFVPDADSTLRIQVDVGAADADALLGKVLIMLQSSDTDQLISGVKYHYAVRVMEAAFPEDLETTLIRGFVKVEDA